MLLAALPAVAAANCPITPQERNLDFRIVEDRRDLACQLPDAKPVTVSYMRRDSILLGDISAMRFSYADGVVQSCNVTEIRVPQ